VGQNSTDVDTQRCPNERIVMILDGAGWHRSGELTEPANLRLLSLPPYAPALNPVENLWDELREKHFHNRVFASLNALEDSWRTDCASWKTIPKLRTPLPHGPGSLKS
jgi:transposase